MGNLNDFMKTSKGFAKNPLGIIALFISLVYGFACIVLSTASSNFETNERIPLIWFLVIFPLVILISFLYLVTKHHRKLYGPGDFKDEKIFLETIDIRGQRSMLDESTVVKSNDFQENSNIPLPKSDRMKNYLIAENLALRILEKEYNIAIRRSVRLKGSKYSFDGLIENGNEYTGIEIKYFNKLDNEYIQPTTLHYKRRFHSHMRCLKKYYPNSNFHFELIIVENQLNTEFHRKLQKQFARERNVNCRFMSFEEIKRQFGIQETE